MSKSEVMNFVWKSIIILKILLRMFTCRLHSMQLKKLRKEPDQWPETRRWQLPSKMSFHYSPLGSFSEDHMLPIFLSSFWILFVGGVEINRDLVIKHTNLCMYSIQYHPESDHKKNTTNLLQTLTLASSIFCYYLQHVSGALAVNIRINHSEESVSQNIIMPHWIQN